MEWARFARVALRRTPMRALKAPAPPRLCAAAAAVSARTPSAVRAPACAAGRVCARASLPRRHAACRAAGEAAQSLLTESWDDVFEEAEQVVAARAVAPVVAAPRQKNRALLVGVALKNQTRAGGATLSLDDSMDELAYLADTAGLEVVGRIKQNLVTPCTRTYIGSGKLLELLEQARSLDADTIIFDNELRPSQARNVERLINADGANADGANADVTLATCRIVDRVELILDIFRQRAATREGFLQVMLARIEYQLPRLTRLWSHLERQSGGGGLAAKGMGESQLEIDKRLLRVQAARIREKLESVRTHRAVHRLRRAAAPLPVVALCGYTSAGKSSLTNLLTSADIFTDPKLFSTARAARGDAAARATR